MYSLYLNKESLDFITALVLACKNQNQKLKVVNNLFRVLRLYSEDWINYHANIHWGNTRLNNFTTFDFASKTPHILNIDKLPDYKLDLSAHQLDLIGTLVGDCRPIGLFKDLIFRIYNNGGFDPADYHNRSTHSIIFFIQ